MQNLKKINISTHKKIWILRFFDHVLDWCVLYWYDFSFRMRVLPWYKKPLCLLHIILLPGEIGRIQFHVFPKEFKTWLEFLNHFEYTLGILMDNKETEWASVLGDALTFSHSSSEIIRNLKIAFRYFLDDKISKKLKLRSITKSYLSYLRQLDNTEGFIFQDYNTNALRAKKVALEGSILYRVSKIPEQAEHGTYWTLERPTLASCASNYHIDPEKMPPLFIASSTLKTDGVIITKKMPAIGKDLVEKVDIIVRDNDALDIIKIESLSQ